MYRSHLHLNLFFSTNLIAHYASLGFTSHAYTLFSSSNSTDVFLWNVMIRGFVDQGFYDRALLLYSQMLELGIHPNNFTFPFAIKACGYLCDFDYGTKLHGLALVCGYDGFVFVGNSLIAMYGKCGKVDGARKVFDEMPEKNVDSWSSIIGAYSQNGYYQEGRRLFGQMLDGGTRPNRVAILRVMVCVYREDDADKICKIVIGNGLDFDLTIQNAAMQMYARCGRIDIARSYFDTMSSTDLFSWASMIEAYVQVDLPLEALRLFKQMILQRVRPNLVALLSVIQACSSLASFKQARFVHGLFDLYVKCGSLISARKVFDKMPERNIISWSSMISGYGIHGRGIEALKLFDQMKVYIKPDHIAFLSVLSACSHAGLVKEGWEIFNSMSWDFQLIPRQEHYACMIDLLGRSGRLNEVTDFIEKMPMKPDASVWGALLGACRIHSNTELAEVAAKHLFELDAENSGRYILMSNIYASSGKRKDADQIRELMRQRGVRKVAGHTIIEIKNNVYTIVAGDTSLPQSDLIYSELEKMMNRIQLEGYKPNLNFVLHDADEVTKEKMLYAHSEKLAVVFGLLNLGPENVIRIRKNLRVCGDCHEAIKFISQVTGREIVMRDARRFHRFKDGTCSCGDYW
ncbi:hypothetical protein UlMin_029896 [Ulmus minor]